MRTSIRTSLTAVALAAVAATACAGDVNLPTTYSEQDQWSFNFWGDIYYLKSMNHPETGATLFGRSYDIFNKNPSIAAMGLDIRRAPTHDLPLEIVIDLWAGRNATIRNRFEPAGPNRYKNYRQKYVAWAPSSNWKIGWGKFDSWMGYETEVSGDNINYSRSFSWEFGSPRYHVGAFAKGQLNDRVDIGIFGVEGWNEAKDSNSDTSFGGYLGFGGNNWRGRLNFYTGEEGSNSGQSGINLPTTDVTAFDAWVEIGNGNRWKWALAGGVNDYDGDNFNGKTNHIAGYGQYKMNDRWTVGGRIERFTDEDGFIDGGGDDEIHLDSATLNFDYATSEKSKLRLELRHDSSNVDAFESRNFNFKDSRTTYSVSWFFRF